MSFLLELITCCGSCSAAKRKPQEETRLLVFQESPRRRSLRRHGRARGCRRRWRPSLSSISEDSLMVEKPNKAEQPIAVWRRNLKRKILSFSRKDRGHPYDREYGRRGRPSNSTIIPAFTPMHFMI